MKTITISEETWDKIKDQVETDKKPKGITIYKRDGSVLAETNAETFREAVEESGADLCGADLCGANLSGADLYDANLYGADLSGANLYGADLMNAKFYGKSGTTKIKKNQVNDFLKALGIIVE